MNTVLRHDGRRPSQARVLTIERNFLPHAEGSVLICTGSTKVVCSASVEERVPPFLKDTGKGWVTAEYGMLPRSTSTRISRDRAASGGRTQEIQRLIGRSLRATVDLTRLGPRTIILDCDVLQADGGTRTAAITGALIALADAAAHLMRKGVITAWPLVSMVAATSVGLVDGVPCLDLDYIEDSQAGVDLNVVQLDSGRFVEIQGTAEHTPFAREEFNLLLDLATAGLHELHRRQRELLETLPEFCASGNLATIH